MLLMKLARTIALVGATLSLAALGGCMTYYSEKHPTTESRQLTAAEDAYWVDRRWRQDKAEEWNRETERQAATRMAREWWAWRSWF